jgi:magnesium transporter
MSAAEEQITFIEQFEQLVESEDKFRMKEFLDDQNISDVAELINEYTEHDTLIISTMAIHRAAMVFKILDVTTQKKVITQLPPSKTAELLNELPPDDRTDFLEELPRNTLRDLIKLLNPEERKVTLSMLGYPEDSVGRIMTPDYVYVYAHNTAAEVLATVRRYAKGSETIDVLYVINEKGEFIDDIRIRDIILAEPHKRVDELIDGRVVVLNAHDDQENASQVFKMNNRVALPVVDDNNILLGIVTIDDMLWVANEEFSEDIQMIGGTQAFEEPYLDIPLLKLFKKRVGWLIILFLGELLTASVMRYFEDEIAKVVFLASFIPLIISSGGNSGSQASTLIIQAMAVGEVTIADWWRVMRREIMSGLLLGTCLGIIGFVRIAIWNEFIPNIYGDVWIKVGLTVGTSLLGIVLWGTLTGSMLPMILKRFGADPAVSSAPFVATLVDVTGLLIYFSVAYLFLQGILL